MKRSIKVHHSRIENFPQSEDIYYSDFKLSADVLSITKFLLFPGSFVSVEFFSVAKTIFSDDYFNMIDIYSIYKDGKVFFSTSPIPWMSDQEVPWKDYRQELVEYLTTLFHKRLRHIAGLDDYYAFHMKYNLLKSIYVGKCKSKYRKFLREFRLLERIAEYRSHTGKAALDKNEAISSEALNVFLSYRTDPELRIRFMLEVLDVLPSSIIGEMIRNIGDAKRYQAVLLYYKLCKMFFESGRYRMAFLYAINTSRLLKQGMNLGFEESMKLDAIGYVKESNWSSILKDVISQIEKFDSLKFGVNPCGLRKADKYAFNFRTAKLEPTSINKCANNTALFNGGSSKVYFTDRFRVSAFFTQITSAYLQGICGRILDTEEEIFIPVHMVLDKLSVVISVFVDIPKLSKTIENSMDEVEIRLEKLVFSGSVHEPIDIGITWVRRRSTVSLRTFESPGYISDGPGRVSLVFDVYNSDGFKSRLIGPSIVKKKENSVSISFEAAQDTDNTYTLHHEISMGIFEVLRFHYSILKL